MEERSDGLMIVLAGPSPTVPEDPVIFIDYVPEYHSIILSIYYFITVTKTLPRRLIEDAGSVC